MKRHEHVEQAKNVTNDNSLDKMKISNDYAQYRTEFIKMLSTFKTICDSHLGWIRAGQHGS